MADIQLDANNNPLDPERNFMPFPINIQPNMSLRDILNHLDTYGPTTQGETRFNTALGLKSPDGKIIPATIIIQLGQAENVV